MKLPSRGPTGSFQYFPGFKAGEVPCDEAVAMVTHSVLMQRQGKQSRRMECVGSACGTPTILV